MEKKKTRRRKNASKCRICNRPYYYCYYGSLCCEGCKQFFRRAVVEHTFYKCWQQQNCTIGISSAQNANANCRRCRLKKCLMVGMDPGKVILTQGMDEELHRKFVDRTKEWQRRLLQGENVQIENLNCAEPESNCVVQKFIDQLGPIERAYKRIWDSTRELPREYANRHSSLAAFLADPENLLAKSGEYSKIPIEFYNNAELVREIEAKGWFSVKTIGTIIEKDGFLCAEIAKTMPFFNKLEMEDRIALLRQISMPFNNLASAFYSHSVCAKTLTRGNGFKAITIMEPKQLKNDPKIKALSRIKMCELVERMALLGLDYQEFLLLMAIMLANTTANNLSPAGRELLYSESLRFTNSLLKMLQTKFGQFRGSERFAAVMNLLAVAFKAKEAQIKLTLYLEVFYERMDPRAFFPKVLDFCFAS